MASNKDLELLSLDVSERGHEQFKLARYQILENLTLSDVSLEEGDAFPEDSDYEIVSAKSTPAKGGGARIVSVVGYKHQVET